MASLSFKDARYSASTPKGPLPILKGLSSSIKPGTMTCLLGASGAGKTTLLNVLAGRILRRRGDDLNIDVTLDGAPADIQVFRENTAFVTQDDIMSEHLTPAEILRFVCELRVPGVNKAEVEARVDSALKRVRLDHRKDQPVGVPGLVRGLSGGERKRCNVAMALVWDPRIIFLDEPTTGLDSESSLQLCKILKSIKGATIFTTLHQPSQEILKLFDKVLIMADGRLVYEGPPGSINGYFQSLGYEADMNANAAGNALKLLAVRGENDREAKSRVRSLIKAFDKGEGDMDTDASNSNSNSNSNSYTSSSGSGERGGRGPAATLSRASGPRQFSSLLKRSVILQLRNPLATKARVGQAIGLGLVLGFIFFRMGYSQSEIQDRMGALFLIAVNTIILSMLSIVITIPTERALFLRERTDGIYSTLSYYAAKTVVDMPVNIILPWLLATIVYWLFGLKNTAEAYFWFAGTVVALAQVGTGLGYIVGGASPDIITAMSIAPAAFVPLFLFSGFLMIISQMPRALSWIRFINPLFYAISLFVQNELRGTKFTCVPNQACRFQTGEQVIHTYQLDLDIDKNWQNFLCIIAFAIGFRIIGYLALLLSTRNKIPRKI
jgi:ABC-type multidrug transport system ATPase subunit